MENPYLVQEPQQARSQDTMQRILDAAAQILETKNFEMLTVVEVVKQANTSVGAFYGRFKDKDALLQALDERFFLEFEQAVQEFLQPAKWDDHPLRDYIEQLTRLILNIYSSQMGVLRSLNLKARLSNDERFRQRTLNVWESLSPRFVDTLLLHREEITHPDPSLAAQLGFQMMFYTLREILLWDSFHEKNPYDDEQLVRELSRAYLAYLGVKERAK